jgi:hypothetical protein
MKAPDFATNEKIDKHHIKIHVSGRVPSRQGWIPWGETYWIPQVRLPRIETCFEGVRDIKVTRIGDK